MPVPSGEIARWHAPAATPVGGATVGRTDQAVAEDGLGIPVEDVVGDGLGTPVEDVAEDGLGTPVGSVAEVSPLGIV